jgi:dipeptidyl-peptidase 4
MFTTPFRRHALLAGLLLLHTLGFAQLQLTLPDAVLKERTELAPARLRGIQWVKGAAQYSHVKDNQLLIGRPDRAADVVLLTLADLNAKLPADKQLKGFPAITWEQADRFRFMHAQGIWVYTPGTKSLALRLALPEDAEHEDIHEATGRVAFTQGDDLFLGLPGNQAPVQVTRDGGNGIVNGRSVHREEYGIHKGTFWSPSGTHIAFYRMDESMVSTYGLEDLSTRPSTFNQIRYPMAGQASHNVTVGVHDIASGNTVFLRTGEPLDQYLTNIAWDPSGRHVHVVHLDRATENLRLVRYDASNGAPVATLLEEHDDIYLEPQHPMEYLPGKGSAFLWRSQQDGWPHLYLHATDGTLQRQLTRGNWVLKEVLSVDPSGRSVLVSGTLPIDPADPRGALETHLYRVETATGRTIRLTAAPGTHTGMPSTDGRYLMDIWSSLDVAGRVDILDARTGKVVKTLLDPSDPLDAYSLGPVELLTITGEGGDRLNARLIKPRDFDPTRRYPVLIYVYNGPHVQLITNSRLAGANLWMYEAARRGYLVWTVDGHGSAHRGRDHEQVIHRRLGEVEVRDQMHGVDFLKSLPYVDSLRIGVYGWSYGGHMTTALLTRYPGTFRVGVAGGPVMDWGLYEVMYTERYMDTPAENPDGYARTALPALAGNLKDDLLIITGGQDDVVLPQHGLTFIKHCVDKNIPVDFFEYPGHAHNVRGRDRLHLMEKVLRYIDQRMQLLPAH